MSRGPADGGIHFVGRHKDYDAASAGRLYRLWVKGKPSLQYFREPPTVGLIKSALRGKNLACWCALDQPCHADVLLELANDQVTNA